jgi:acyl-CoA synthetase (AMP-forming)/AMP-acid ligase II
MGIFLVILFDAGVLCHNSHQVLECHFAVAGMLGAALLNMNPRLVAPELAHIFSDASPSWLIASDKCR